MEFLNWHSNLEFLNKYYTDGKADVELIKSVNTDNGEVEYFDPVEGIIIATLELQE